MSNLVICGDADLVLGILLRGMDIDIGNGVYRLDRRTGRLMIKSWEVNYCMYEHLSYSLSGFIRLCDKELTQPQRAEVSRLLEVEGKHLGGIYSPFLTRVIEPFPAPTDSSCQWRVRVGGCWYHLQGDGAGTTHYAYDEHGDDNPIMVWVAERGWHDQLELIRRLRKEDQL